MPLPRNCAQCGRQMYPLGSVEALVGRPKRFCDKSCRQKWHYAHRAEKDRKPFSFRIEDFR